MIDWDRPIETVYGHQARYISGMASGTIVYVLGGPGRCGDVFLVNDEGYRCDDRAIYSKLGPLIRNVRVKREGWARVINNNGLPFMPGDVVFSEKASAEAACQKLGGMPAFITWEEWP